MGLAEVNEFKGNKKLLRGSYGKDNMVRYVEKTDNIKVEKALYGSTHTDKETEANAF